MGASALALAPAWGAGGGGAGGPWAICGWLGGRGLMMAVSGPPVAGPVVGGSWGRERGRNHAGVGVMRP